MDKNIEIGKTYWYVDNYSNFPQQCKIIEHISGDFISEDNEDTFEEYWVAKCISSSGTRGFFAKNLFETKKEAIEELERRHRESLKTFKKSIDTPEKLMKEMMSGLCNLMSNIDILSSEEIEGIIRERIKEFFNVEI